MKVLKTPTVSITAGLLVSLIVLARLISVAIEWRAGTDPTLIGFLSDPSRFLFVTLITVLLFCIWFIRGSNNRMVYVFWCLGYSTHYFLYWAGMECFFYTETANRNIYALNWISTTSIIPLLLLCRYRHYMAIYVFAVMIRFDVYKSAAESYFKKLKTTDFEAKLRRGASLWFAVEFCFSSYFTLFGILHSVGPKESLWSVMEDANVPDVFPFYYGALDLITIYFAILIVVNAIRDSKVPDKCSIYSLTEKQKQKLAKGHKPSKFDPF